jgi:hypothetical protein
VAVLPDGHRALSGSSYTLKLWDRESGCYLATFTGGAAIMSVAVAGDHLSLRLRQPAPHVLRLVT